MKRSLTFLLILSILLTLFSGCDSGSTSTAEAGTGLVICEVMSSNKTTVADKDGEYPDYIVLYNRSNKRISLMGWAITDNKVKPKKWELPALYLEAGEYFTVFASGKDMEQDGEYHTNFSISASGEEIYLVAPSGEISQQMYIPAMPSDIAYGLEDHRAGQSLCFYAKGMPGQENTSAKASSVEALAGSDKKLLITEYMNNNRFGIKDNYGEYSDYAVITNLGAECILSGLFLSDDESEPEKWELPGNVKLATGESVTVWLSGKNEYKDGELHASFGLSSEDKVLVLSDNIGTVDSVELEYLPANVSKAMMMDQSSVWLYHYCGTKVSPGYADLAQALGLEAKRIWINEVSSVATKEGSYDWIELYNGSGNDVSLEGWSITDDLTKVGYTFSSLTVRAGGFKLLYASGEVENASSSSVYLPFKINNRGTELYLLDPNGIVMDYFETGKLDSGYTSGRVNGNSQRVFFDKPTPEAKNSKGYAGYAAMPVITDGGHKKIGDKVNASTVSGQVLRYTTDGSEPTEQSKQMGELTLNKTTVLKVKAFADGLLPSDTATATYVIGEHYIPVVAISADPDGLFGHSNGILANGPGYTSTFPHSGANFWKDWERRVTFEYITAAGDQALCLDAGIKVFGQYSRGYDQKSLAVHFRDSYGASEVTYPFFKNNQYTTVKHLVLRAGGQDQKSVRLRDAFCAQVLKGTAKVAIMDWAPVALYINGEYWGYYDLREKINEDYLASHYGLDASNVTIIKNDSRALEGTNVEIKALYTYVKSHDLTVKENYDYVCSVMDIDSFIDYLIAEIFFANGDTGNKKCFKENTEGSKWQWVIFDMDMTMRPEALWGDRYNTIEMLFNPGGHGSNNGFTTCLQRTLIKNKDFRKKFITRYAELLNTIFMPENLNLVIDTMAAQIDAEMKNHGTRWNRPSYSTWQTELGYLRNILDKRRKIAMEQLIKFCSITDAEKSELFPNG